MPLGPMCWGRGLGVRTCAGVAFCGVSHFQSDFMGSLCFRHVRRIPFSDYLEITTAIIVQCGRAVKRLPVD